MRPISKLSPDYSAEVDSVDEPTWHQFLRQYDDANIYQAWTGGKLTGRGRCMGHLVLRKKGEVVAIAMPRITKVPLINAGDAYLRWGPLWRRRGTEENTEIFRQAVRALRNEYTCKRGLVLRLYPNLYVQDAPRISEILREEGFSPSERESRYRTILMNLGPCLKTLRAGMGQHAKRHLKAAERNGLEVVEGQGDDLFQSFLNIYDEMIRRKGFTPGADPRRFRLLQFLLPDDMKLKILLCRSKEGICAGLIGSVIGKMAVAHFAATSNAGLKSNGTYLLHWRFIEELKQRGVSIYNLDGIDPVRNPGTYQFKKGFSGQNGRETDYLGRFDSHVNSLSYSCVEFGEKLKSTYQGLREIVDASHSAKHGLNTAH
jgi:FemAB family